MSMLIVNMIIEWLDTDTDTPLKERVLWIDPCGDAVFVIDISNAASLPILRTRLEIESALDDEAAIHLTIDPFSRLVAPVDVPAKHLEIRDRNWEKISGLVSQEPDIYLDNQRKKLILKNAESVSGAIDKIYDYLRKFWKRGMIKNALLPDYVNCGAPGKERGIRDGRKRGRKPKVIAVAPEMVGVNVDEDIKRIFNIAFKRYYHSTKKNPLKRAYKLMIDHHFNHGHRMQDGLSIPISAAAHLVPTLGQFTYWYHQHKNLIHSLVSREGRRSYELRHRPILGNSAMMAFGPGSIYQVDATIADVYLVSEIDRNRIIGRPVLYFCMDVFTRLCVGLHVALEGPSWLTGMMALANATTDKVAFCAEFDINISANDWPCSYLPEKINGDRGEFISIPSDHLVADLNIPFANCAPFRGDLKGIVERSFRRANDTCIKWIPGAVRKREQGDPDYRLDATMTIKELTGILILMVIEYNLFHRMDDYPLDKDMMSDGVEPVPIELWNWGLVNRTGHLREKSPDIVKLALMPRDTATVTMKGVRFKGMFYSCGLALREQWFVKARHSGNWTLEASYDPRKPEVIYLILSGGRLEPCLLLPRDERFKDLQLEEILEFQEVNKQKSSLHKSLRVGSSGELSAYIDNKVANAAGLTAAAHDHSTSDRARVGSIQKNRQEDKELLREEQAWDLRLEDRPPQIPVNATVTVIRNDDQIDVSASITAVKKRRLLDAIQRSEKGGEK